MTTPILSFVEKYAKSQDVRMHMPGHKGVSSLGFEAYDITEISGADVLYSPDGIICESENNLSEIYGSYHSFYSTQGSTLAIFAMLDIATRRRGADRPYILAARNVHTAFVKAAALLDLEVGWIYPEEYSHLCSCSITSDELEKALNLAERVPHAVYVTSPDYLGNILDIASLSKVCKKYGVPLLVDNAHGAYLKFLEQDCHPITLGAAMCADSAHKTLPVLTGGAYLHVSKDYADYAKCARSSLALFASTSPSYLTLASLDLCNKRLSEDYPRLIKDLATKVCEIKEKISSFGFEVVRSEELKSVVKAGHYLSDHLRSQGIECEFSDREYTVLMLTPENTESDFDRLITAFSTCERRENGSIPPVPQLHSSVMSIREAIFSPTERIAVKSAVGRISATPSVSCPPAVPIVVSGERICEQDILSFDYYGVEFVDVVKEI